MSFFKVPPAPKSHLGIYRMLAPNAAVRVSPLCLGTMNFGDAWKGHMGECNKDTAEEILDLFYENGGNFIDTANFYQAEESEIWLGEWMQKRNNRDQLVIATKYSCAFRAGHGDREILVNTMGNGTKSLHVSVEASLRKLQTSYIDLLYVHFWDYTASIEETMQSLNALVTAGKVLYLGVSDTPAWVVAKANAYARAHALRPFSVYQGRWSAEHRDLEREIIPMCVDEGMAICAFGALGGGNFKTAKQFEAARLEGAGAGRAGTPSEGTIKVAAVLEGVAERRGTAITSVALAYVMQKAPYVFPIVGGRNIEHLKGNIEALGLELSGEEIEEIEAAKEFDLGFPMNIFGRDPESQWVTAMAGKFQYVKAKLPIKPAKLQVE